jgi:activator of 2-hydroxyglutaryl-CoA dehydratase
MIGGVGRNCGFASAVKKQLGVEKLLIPEEPEYGAAAGAAVVAGET